MRNLLAALAVLTLAACGDAEAPATGPAGSTRSAAELASPDQTVLNTQLRPEAEVRPVDTTDPVESVARGHVQLKLSGTDQLSVHIKVHNPAAEDFFVGHIHQGPPSVNGPVVQFLFGPLAPPIEALHFDLREEIAIDPALASAIRSDPSAFYVNLHTVQDPVGAIRGQLR